MRDESIGQGETISLQVTVDDDDAATATFVATDGNTNIIEETVAFVDLVADLQVTDTIVPVGTYDYYIKITCDDGRIDYLPDFSLCNDECVLPQLTVCEIPGVS